MKITEILVAEHRIFLNVFEQIERALTGVATLSEARMLARIVKGMLESHASTETELAYLALDHVLQDKGQLDRLHEEHDEIDTSLHLVDLAGDAARARSLLQTAIMASRRHFAEIPMGPMGSRPPSPSMRSHDFQKMGCPMAGDRVEFRGAWVCPAHQWIASVFGRGGSFRTVNLSH